MFIKIWILYSYHNLYTIHRNLDEKASGGISFWIRGFLPVAVNV